MSGIIPTSGIATGTANTRLVVLRGNSGSGKSTVARHVRAAIGSGVADLDRNHFRNGVALIGQDDIRRDLLGEPARENSLNIRLIDTIARMALDDGFNVVVEGMLFAEHYEQMLTGLTRDHLGVTGNWYFDLPLEVTLERHAQRGKYEVTDEQLTEWYRPRDLLRGVDERIITAEYSIDDAVAAIVAGLADTGLAAGQANPRSSTASKPVQSGR